MEFSFNFNEKFKSINRENFDFKLRTSVMGGVFCVLLLLVILRYAWISFFPTPLRLKLVETAAKQFEINVTVARPRATITDRNGNILAISVSRQSIYLLNRKMPKDIEILEKVSNQLGVSLDDFINYSKDKRSFIWLRRQLTQDEFSKIGSLKKWQDFIGVVDEPKRYYPEKNIASQLIGFVGMEGNGLEGIEKIYNSVLKIKPVKAEVMRDARGRLVMLTPNEASKPEQKVQNLRLSIDLYIQEITQNALSNGVIKTRAQGGSAVVMDVKTGEILAMASYPTYDLNNPPENAPESRRFRPIMDAIELGSVVKPMFVAKALDVGVITSNSKIFAENGQMQIPGGIIHDTHSHSWLTPEEVLKVSSNIGAYKIVQKLGREAFYKTLFDVGFGRSPGTGLPGEWGGHIRKLENWREMNFANMAFGQGFAISPLQLVHALSIITGGGLDRGVKIIAQEKNVEEENSNHNVKSIRYIKSGTSKLIVKMMESVVEEEGGTGSLARIPGVLVAGKTGTAQIWSPKLRSYADRTAVFEGVLPANDPKLAIVVVLDRVGVRPAYGGILAGPVFAEIGRNVAYYMNSQGTFSLENYENAYLKKMQTKNDL